MPEVAALNAGELAVAAVAAARGFELEAPTAAVRGWARCIAEARAFPGASALLGGAAGVLRGIVLG